MYWGVQGACPGRAVTHAGGTAERSERRAVGMGLKLVEPWVTRESTVEKNSEIIGRLSVKILGFVSRTCKRLYTG